jgi:hypothetical protein
VKCYKKEKKMENQQDESEEGVNIIISEQKSLIILNLKRATSMKQLKSFKKLNKISEGYFFYENNRELSLHQILRKGNHLIHFYSRIIGGARFNYFQMMENHKEQAIEVIEELGDDLDRIILEFMKLSRCVRKMYMFP